MKLIRPTYNFDKAPKKKEIDPRKCQWDERILRVFLKAMAFFSGDLVKVSKLMGFSSREEIVQGYLHSPEKVEGMSKKDYYEMCVQRKKAMYIGKDPAFPSLFARKVAPIIVEGYDGLESLVDLPKFGRQARKEATDTSKV